MIGRPLPYARCGAGLPLTITEIGHYCHPPSIGSGPTVQRSEGLSRGVSPPFDVGAHLPEPTLPTRPRYTGRMPAWAWIAIFGLCIAAVLPVIQSSNVTESGAELLALEAEREQLKSDVRSLATHVGTLGSLTRIEEQAKARLNMVRAEPTVILTVDHPAPARVMPSRFLPNYDAVATPPRSAPSGWLGLLEFFIFD